MRKSDALTNEHQLLLDQGAIAADYAQKLGIRSVIEDSDLPAELSHLSSFLPGILYPLPRLDGTVVNQLRIDNPPLDDDGKPQGKYRQEKGSGTVISVWGSMRERVGHADTLVIVEGTKQAIAATSLLKDDPNTLVVGIQGCWGWAQDQAMSPDLVDILTGNVKDADRPIKKVIIIFDADIADNLRVWQAAKALRQAIASASSILPRNVRFASLAFLGGKQGLDDYMGSTAISKRKGKLEALLSSAGALGRAPSNKGQSSSVKMDRGNSRVEVDMEKGRIVEVTEKIGADGEPYEDTKVILGAAALIERSEQVVSPDPLQEPEQNLYIRVVIPTATGVREYPNIAVPDAKLSDAGYWLRKVPGSMGVTVARSSKPEDAIGIAIREASTNIEHTAIVRRTGWVNTADPENPKWVWAAANGGVGVDGVDPVLVGRPPSQDWAKIRFKDPDLEGDPEKEKKAAAHNFLYIHELLNNPMQWQLIVSAVGLAFLPVVPNVTLGYFGPRSSGKSTLAQAAAACYTPDWGPQQTPMASFHATTSALDLIANGLHDSILHVDDLKPETSRNAQEATLQGLDSLVRRAFGAGGRKRGTVDKATGIIGMAQTDDAAPLVIVTGENVPTGSAFPESGLDRIIIMRMEPEKTFKHVPDPSNKGKEDDGSISLNQFYHRVKTGNFPLMLASYLQFIAGLIENYPDVDPLLKSDPFLEGELDLPMDPLQASQEKMVRFRSWLEDRRVHWTASLDKFHHKVLSDSRVSDRARRSAGGLMLGMEMYLKFALSVGAVDEDEVESLQTTFFNELAYLISDGASVYMGGNDSEVAVLMNTIKSVLASKRATLNPDEASSSMQLVGEIKENVRGQRAVVLNHQALAKIIDYPQGERGIAAAFRDIAIRQESQNGVTVSQRIGGQSVRCIAIPMTKWDPEGVFEAQLSTDF